MQSAVLLLSSGLDSASHLELAKKKYKIQYAVTFDYGQKAAKRELEQAEKLARKYDVPWLAISVVELFQTIAGSKSALIGSSSLPSLKNLDDLSEASKTAKAVWVPNRNGIFIELAAAFAESKEVSVVLVGFNQEEAATFPDNSFSFMKTITESLKFSTSNQVQLESLTVHLVKSEIVKKLNGSEFPFELLWSCYQGLESHCGKCESCQRLKRALLEGLSKVEAEVLIHRMFVAC